MIHRYGLVSDTHGAVHPHLHQALADVEAIFHAGDVCGENVMAELRIHASVYAVMGNMDSPGNPMLPLQRVVEMPFGRVGMTHGHLQDASQPARVKGLLEMFRPRDVRLILHGHTHLQFMQYQSGVYVVNPGAAGRPRFGDPTGFCLMEWDSDRDLLRFDFQQLAW